MYNCLFGCSGCKDGLPLLPGASPPVGSAGCGPSGLSQHFRKPVWYSAGPGGPQRSCHVLCHSDSSDVTGGGSDWWVSELRVEETHTFFSLKCCILSVLHFLCLADYQPAQRWLKLSSACDGYSSNNTLHGGKIPRRLASQMVESVWQEYNINRTGHKYV